MGGGGGGVESATMPFLALKVLEEEHALLF